MLSRVVKLSISPPNIIFPYPIIPTLVGLFGGDFQSLWKPLVITFVLYPAINLWNHVNDADDDFRAGKDTPFINDKVKKFTIAVIFSLYLFSAVIAYLIGGITCLAFLFVVFLATFLYSDNTVFKLRLKKHYFWELLVYAVSVPAYILMLYSSVTSVNIEGIKLAIIFLPFMLSTVFVKDLKDISADRMAGLKTLGVVFQPETLIMSFSFSVLIYFALVLWIFYGTLYFISAVPVIGVLVGILGFVKCNWRISKATVKYYLIIFYSALVSVLIFLGTAAYLSLFES